MNLFHIWSSWCCIVYVLYSSRQSAHFAATFLVYALYSSFAKWKESNSMGFDTHILHCGRPLEIRRVQINVEWCKARKILPCVSYSFLLCAVVHHANIYISYIRIDETERPKQTVHMECSRLPFLAIPFVRFVSSAFDPTTTYIKYTNNNNNNNHSNWKEICVITRELRVLLPSFSWLASRPSVASLTLYNSFHYSQIR